LSYWHRESDKFAAFYEGRHRFSPKRFVSLFLDARTTYLMKLADVGAQDVVLDLACGSGIHVEPLARRARAVVGVDYSAGMIGTARGRLRASALPNWNLAVADAHHLPFPDARFDRIVSMGLLDYVSSPSDVLKECRRVLRPGGRIVFTMPKNPTVFWPLRARVAQGLRRALFDLPPIANAVSSRELEALLQAVDLQVEHAGSIWTAMWMVKAARPSATR
jgi:ubiquinone/menaquinone biosynthesis C-methylase UbiE